jgi:hypothetical protein
MVCPVCVLAPIAVSSGTGAAYFKTRNGKILVWGLSIISVIAVIAIIVIKKKGCGEQCPI